jgi:hypothetical protein
MATGKLADCHGGWGVWLDVLAMEASREVNTLMIGRSAFGSVKK